MRAYEVDRTVFGFNITFLRVLEFVVSMLDEHGGTELASLPALITT